MNVAKDRVVSVTYHITDERGEPLERIDLPVSFVYGDNSGLYPRVNEALEGLEEGESIAVELSPEDAFGAWDPQLTFSDRIENVPPEYRRIGAEADFMNDRGESRKFVVTHVDSGSVTLDGNHPFAGKKLTFHITVVKIRAATAQELENGVSQTPGAMSS